jgi:hypothetical protein
MNRIPDNAERHDLLDWVKSERQLSRFLPAVNRLAYILFCPGCETRIGEMPATFEHDCKCGLHLQGSGLVLNIWRCEALQPAE